MATINHKTYNEATETFKDFNVYDGKETLIFKVDGEGQKASFEKPVSFAGGLEGFVSSDQPAIYRAFSTTGSYPFDRYGDLVIQARSSHDRNIVFAAGTSPAVIASMTSNGLCFGSDTAAANALDDYEEGTWTPAISNGTTEVAISDSYSVYTKIGNKVTVNTRTVNGDLTSFSSGDVISFVGLPYTAGADSYGTMYIRSAASGDLLVFANVGNGSTRVQTTTTVGSLISGNSDYWFTITYFV